MKRAIENTRKTYWLYIANTRFGSVRKMKIILENLRKKEKLTLADEQNITEITSILKNL